MVRVMMKSAWAAAIASVGAALTMGGIGSAPTASAACQPTPIPGESYCDKPVGPNGIWERCYQRPSTPIFGPRGVMGEVTPPPECYPVDPAQPAPLGQPPNHIDD
jgi:hypothetical protein